MKLTPSEVDYLIHIKGFLNEKGINVKMINIAIEEINIARTGKSGKKVCNPNKHKDAKTVVSPKWNQ